MAVKIKDYEKKFAELETIVEELESNKHTISDMLTIYKKGLTLMAECSEILNQVEETRQSLLETMEVKP